VHGAPDPVERLSTAARFIGVDAESARERIHRFIEKIRELQRRIGEPLCLKEVGITEKEMNEGIEALVRLGISDPNMYTTPCACKEEELRGLFRDMWEGREAPFK
ncbi:MAG TPA: iron-containing alcohol dehydrogenase, partial [Acidobacteriota bacterium]|nr:iron-containing alcohol dehydrogenase [Acidobacteriota bacterium]